MPKVRFIRNFSNARQSFHEGTEHEVGGIDSTTAANAVASGFAVPIDDVDGVPVIQRESPAPVPAEPAAIADAPAPVKKVKKKR